MKLWRTCKNTLDKPNRLDYTAFTATEIMMTEAQSDLQFALKMLGDALVVHAKDKTDASYDNVCFWQQQAWHCAEAIAKTN